jgi:predicted PurR-regulated permease PerM
MKARNEPPADRQLRTLRIELSFRSVLAVVAVAISLWLLTRLWQIVLVVVIALVLAGSLSPVVDWLEHRHVRRGIALGLVLLLLVLVVVGLAFLVVPALVSQIESLVKNAPAIQREVADRLAAYPPPLSDYASTFRDAQPDRYLKPIGETALTYAATALELVTYALTTVVLAFYLIIDRERVLGFIYALIPREYHVRTARVLLGMQRIVGGYVRGQAVTSALIGVFVFALLTLLHAPSALALAIFAAFTDLIPFVGGILSTTPCVLAALTRGVVPAIIVLVAIVVYQELESRLVVPRVYGQTLRLSPVAVTIALLVGGKLLGIIGALLALPIAAGIRVLVEDLRIALPGEQPGEADTQDASNRAETDYADRADGVPLDEAAAIATQVAENLAVEEADTVADVTKPIGSTSPRVEGR